MMAYDDGFVLAVIHDGYPVREIKRKVHLPFHSEYKIRLKNKHSYLRALAKVFIDGRPVSNMGDFILKPGQTLDLERFLDESMERGNKFKFVPLSDGRVNDPTDSENGIIKVEFYREVDWNKNMDFDTFKKNERNYPTPRKGGGVYKSLDYSYNGTFTNNTLGPSTISRADWCVEEKTSGDILSSVQPCAASSPGATVEGGTSHQNFHYGDWFATEAHPTKMSLQIRGLTSNKLTSGSVESKAKFCANCGKRRPKMTDRFCSRCGKSY